MGIEQSNVLPIECYLVMTESTITPVSHKPTGKPLLPPRKQEYTYHWGLILGVAVLLLALGGIVGYGYHSWFPSTPEEGMEIAVTQPEPQVLLGNQPINMDDERIQQSLDEGSATELEQEPLPEQTAEDMDPKQGTEGVVKPLLEEAIIVDGELLQPYVASELVEIDSPAVESAPPSEADLVELETTEEVSAEPTYYVDPEPVADVENSAEMLAVPAEEEPVQTEDSEVDEIQLQPEADSLETAERAVTENTTSGLFQLAEFKILEPAVKRFLLTKSVSNKEPQGELADINFNADGWAVIWAYSEVIELSGSQLNYVWLYEGSQVAKVPVNVRGIRWRSYSSKNVNQDMTGNWRVELQDGEGRLLASADFLF